MPFEFNTVTEFQSKICPGVKVFLLKMTEGRRIELRRAVSEHTKRLREIGKEQTEIEKKDEAIRDTSKWLELQDEFDKIMIENVNPSWIKWGVKSIEGLMANGKPLGIEDWTEWPSNLVKEVVQAVKDESELDGGVRQNLESPTTSGAAVAANPSSTTAPTAGRGVSTVEETVDSTTQVA